MKKITLLIILTLLSNKIFASAEDTALNIDYKLLLLKTSNKLGKLENEENKIKQQFKDDKSLNMDKMVCKFREITIEKIETVNVLIDSEDFKKDKRTENARIILEKAKAEWENAINNANIVYKGKLDEVCKELEEAK